MYECAVGCGCGTLLQNRDFAAILGYFTRFEISKKLFVVGLGTLWAIWNNAKIISKVLGTLKKVYFILVKIAIFHNFLIFYVIPKIYGPIIFGEGVCSRLSFQFRNFKHNMKEIKNHVWSSGYFGQFLNHQKLKFQFYVINLREYWNCLTFASFHVEFTEFYEVNICIKLHTDLKLWNSRYWDEQQIKINANLRLTQTFQVLR